MSPLRQPRAETEAAITPGSASFAPVRGSERKQAIDVLRGFALFGILWMNAPTNGEPATRFDHGIQFFASLLADGKFFTLYSFLFGLGFSVQLLRAKRRGARIVPVYLRRLAVLLLIGLAHSIFLWHGDILQNYAVLGVLLLPLINCSPRFLLVLAGLCLAFNVFSSAALDAMGSLRRAEPEAARAESLQAEVRDLDPQITSQRIYSTAENGTYVGLASARAARQLSLYSNPEEWSDGIIFCMFLLGLYAGGRGIFQDTSVHLPFIRRVMWWGLGLGLACNVATAMESELGIEFPSYLGGGNTGALYTIGRPALCLFYVSAILLLMHDSKWRERLRFLSCAGRMGLTNYLLQSLIFTTAFYHYGFGLISKASAPLALVFAVVTFAFQIMLSKWWMGQFQNGPMEWLWRSLTYRKLQPMRAVRP